jgi:hypothetical protein
MSTKLASGNTDARRGANDKFRVFTKTANGALPVTRSARYRMVHAGAWAMTVATPTKEGVEIHVTNNFATGGTVTVTGMDADAAGDVFTLAAATATARPKLILTAINVAAAGVKPVLKWESFFTAGVTVA